MEIYRKMLSMIKVTEEVTFGSLEVGDTFIEGGDLYIKMSEESPDTTDNAFCLTSGDFYAYYYNETVAKVID